MTATCGLSGSSSLASAALQSLLANKLQARSTGSILYQLTWKERITPSGWRICALRASTVRISDKGSILLQGYTTPQAHDATGRSENQKMIHGTKHGCACLTLDVQLAGWPTAVSNPANGEPEAFLEHKKKSIAKGNSMGESVTDIQMVAKLAGWPTTNATDSTGAGRSGRQGGANLQTATSELNFNQPMRLCSDGRLLIGSIAGMESGGRLNPAHSRWLMRLPQEWDDCAPMAMRSISKRQRNSAAQSAKLSQEYDL